MSGLSEIQNRRDDPSSDSAHQHYVPVSAEKP